ncbi:MAG: outer membrane protein assembly factor BamD [Paludibacter sp.]|jgi:outer membrane protein assembly factor BamD|nr:outer membrane protein assembly factor BamD [Paludibacter sp.]
MSLKNILIISLVVFATQSCSQYQKLLKSTDPELKYNKAVEYFDKKDFMRATTLFEEVQNYFKGTDRSETLLNYLANAYLGQKDYYTAQDYFRAYTRTYPKGKFIQDVKFKIAYCYYLQSPDPRLDQTATGQAIEAFQEFIDFYPENERVPEAVKLQDEMSNKMSYKELLNARLYYNLGNYLGNNYESAVITAGNVLKKYPANKYREELSFIVVDGKYQQALNSFEMRKADRFRNTIDECYSFLNEFPSSKYKKQIDKILQASKQAVGE